MGGVSTTSGKFPGKKRESMGGLLPVQCRVSLCLREGNIVEGDPLKKLWDIIVFSDIYFIPDNLFEKITGILWRHVSILLQQIFERMKKVNNAGMQRSFVL